jgi:Transposase DDE domain
MSTATNSITVNQAFFQPLEGLAARSPASKPCPEFSDDDFLRLGVQRVLESSESGRAFLQEHGVRFENTPELGNYFATLRSARRCEVLRDAGAALVKTANERLHDRLADIPELAKYECFAGDGHWHKAAAHDPRHEGVKMAVGHFYALNLRTHTLQHLAAGQGLHEHDMSALKRIKPKGLRQGVPKGRRVLMIYDKAGIDLAFWKRCRQECALYFISRAKENMVFDWLESVPVDSSDPRQRGVTEDRRVLSREGHPLRIVFYTDPQTGESYEFLTNEPDLPPGVIVELYRRRWEAEKTFDQIKNKLGEKKAWATSLEAKEAQALFIAIAHNLLLIYEQKLEREHRVRNRAEDQRRTKRMAAAAAKCKQAGHSLSTLVTRARRATQRSVKFVRWVRQALRDQAAEAAAVLRLMDLYAAL